jgi:hypothetical protein
VDYFLVQFKREAGPPEDGRQRTWCGLEDALERLSYQNNRKLLRKTWKQLPSKPR